MKVFSGTLYVETKSCLKNSVDQANEAKHMVIEGQEKWK
jgi:hypothetical protein